MLEELTLWLQTFPKWEDVLHFDYADSVPGNTGLFPRGITELSCRQDVLGNRKSRLSCGFILRRAAAGSRENAQWLLDFQNWVMEQDRLGLTPKFGDEPESQRIRAFEGRLDTHKQVGCAFYTVQLTVEFTKIFEVK